MADEISISFDISMEDSNGEVIQTWSPDEFLRDIGAEIYVDEILDIGTSEETLSFGDIATKGEVVLYNRDATNYVSWGFTTGQLKGKLNPGKFAFLTMDNSGDLIVQANNAACKVKFIAYAN